MADNLYPHQHAALVAELKSKDYDGKTANAAFAELTVDFPLRLGTVQFLTQEQFDEIPEKRRATLRYSIIGEEDLAKFRFTQVDPVTKKETVIEPGIPGFPNKLLRGWFNTAWKEARG